MTQVISNDVSAIQPELWSSMVQVPLYKSLVALEVANMRLSDTLKNGDTINKWVVYKLGKMLEHLKAILAY